MRHKLRLSLSVCGLLLALVIPSLLIAEAAHDGPTAPRGRDASDAPDAAAAARIRQNYGQLPLSFEANHGQADRRVQFLARNHGYSLYLAADGFTLALRGTAEAASVVRFELLGASRRARARGLDELAGKSNYLVGRDPSRWRTNIPNYARVGYEGVYPGVDVVYYGNQRQLEYDFNLAPGADPSRIILRVEGAEQLRVDEHGDLVLRTAAGDVRQRAPHAYQEVGGARRTIECRYAPRDGGLVGFELGEYDRSLPLVIDPVLAYSTFLGGSSYDEGAAIAVDTSGHAYVTGAAASWDFPVGSNPLQPTRGGRARHEMTYDAFVAKLSSDGSGLVYSTYLGGVNEDHATSIAVDDQRHVYVAGQTSSANFPTTEEAYRTTLAGSNDIFVAQLSASGSSLVYSTYLGGTDFEADARLALGAGGAVYVGGRTYSTNFPTTPGAFQIQMRADTPWSHADAFVTKLSPDGAGLLFSTYLGGGADDFVEGLAAAPGLDDSVYVTGRTSSANFPTTPGAFQTAHASGGQLYDAFVTRLDASGSALVYSTYFGGASDDFASAVAVDSAGAAYVVGLTSSPGLPVTPGALQTTFAGGTPDPTFDNNYDAFITKFSPDGRGLVYSTFFGGNGGDKANAVALDPSGNAYVAGETGSTNLPVSPGALQSAYGGGFFDGFFLKLSDAGTGLRYASYLGGGDREQVMGLALDFDSNVYLTGTTASYDFITTPISWQPEFNRMTDAFVTKVMLGALDLSVSGRVTNQFHVGLRDVEINVGGGVNRVVRTDSEGYYWVSGLAPGSDVSLTATRHGFAFDPPEINFWNLQQDQTANFSGPAPLVISGRITNDFGHGVSVPVVLSGTLNTSAYSDHEGGYFFTVPAGGNYTVTPAPDPLYTFAPASHRFLDLIGDVTLDFRAQRPVRLIARAVDDFNIGIPDITITITGPTLPQPLVAQTDASGYVFTAELERGATYTATPSDPATNRSFAPPALTVENLQREEFVIFTALPPLAIGGRVVDPSGQPVSADVKLSGAVNAVAATDSSGHFFFPNLPRGGDYAVTVTKPGSLYTFSPQRHSVTNLQEFQFFEYTALPPLRIVGRVAESFNTPVRATLTLSGAVSATTQADESGFYSFENLPRGGSYTVTPSFPLYTFAPASHSVTDIQEITFFDFDALPPLRIIGNITDDQNAVITGATVTLAGAVNATATPDEFGIFRFENLPRGGNYTVTVAHDLYDFTPPSLDLPALGENQFLHFGGALRRFTLGGRVTEGAGGSPLAGVTVTLAGSSGAVAQTDADGRYAFPGLAVGRPYHVTAARPGFAFAPQRFDVADPRADVASDFDGTRLTYTLSGRAADADGGAGLGGVTVTLGGSLNATTQTDAQGNYSFTGLPSEGDYTLTAAHPNFDLAPGTYNFDDLLADGSAAFEGTRRKHRIAGRVADGSGVPLAGATVTLGGARAAATQTDADGRYLFADLPAGFGYTVSAAKTHYAVSPSARQVEDLGADQTADFTAELLTHAISGRVLDANGNGFAGAVVSLTGTRSATTNADAGGNYLFASLPAGGSYAVEPSRQFYDFTPARAVFNDLGSAQAADFTAVLRTFRIGGRVAEGAGGVAGVTVQLTGSRTATAQTDANGNYLFASLPADGAYAVTPAHAFYNFAPASASFNTLPADQTADFAAARKLYQVGGYALDPCGRPLAGVTMSLARSGLTVTAQTNATGFYAFTGVPAGYDYALAPDGSTHTYAPASYAFNALGASQTANFTGQPVTSTTLFAALADLYVRGGSATSNFGTSTQLITRLASLTKDTHETYVKFNAGSPCTVTSVKLRLYGRLSSSGTLPVRVYAVPATTWTETGTNWNNRPAAGALLRAVNVVGTASAWYEWDVTDYVRAELAAGRGTVSFVLRGASTTSFQATFNSREAAGANAPRLAVTTP